MNYINMDSIVQKLTEKGLCALLALQEDNDRRAKLSSLYQLANSKKFSFLLSYEEEFLNDSKNKQT